MLELPHLDVPVPSDPLPLPEYRRGVRVGRRLDDLREARERPSRVVGSGAEYQSLGRVDDAQLGRGLGVVRLEETLAKPLPLVRELVVPPQHVVGHVLAVREVRPLEVPYRLEDRLLLRRVARRLLRPLLGLVEVGAAPAPEADLADDRGAGPALRGPELVGDEDLYALLAEEDVDGIEEGCVGRDGQAGDRPAQREVRLGGIGRRRREVRASLGRGGEASVSRRGRRRHRLLRHGMRQELRESRCRAGRPRAQVVLELPRRRLRNREAAGSVPHARVRTREEGARVVDALELPLVAPGRRRGGRDRGQGLGPSLVVSAQSHELVVAQAGELGPASREGVLRDRRGDGLLLQVRRLVDHRRGRLGRLVVRVRPSVVPEGRLEEGAAAGVVLASPGASSGGRGGESGVVRHGRRDRGGGSGGESPVRRGEDLHHVHPAQTPGRGRAEKVAESAGRLGAGGDVRAEALVRRRGEVRGGRGEGRGLEETRRAHHGEGRSQVILPVRPEKALHEGGVDGCGGDGAWSRSRAGRLVRWCWLSLPRRAVVAAAIERLHLALRGAYLTFHYHCGCLSSGCGEGEERNAKMGHWLPPRAG